MGLIYGLDKMMTSTSNSKMNLILYKIKISQTSSWIVPENNLLRLLIKFALFLDSIMDD